MVEIASGEDFDGPCVPVGGRRLRGQVRPERVPPKVREKRAHEASGDGSNAACFRRRFVLDQLAGRAERADSDRRLVATTHAEHVHEAASDASTRVHLDEQNATAPLVRQRLQLAQIGLHFVSPLVYEQEKVDFYRAV